MYFTDKTYKHRNRLFNMAITSFDLVNGISTWIMLSIGYGMGIRTLKLWRDKKDHLILITAILFFSLPTPWLSAGVRFLLYLFDVHPTDAVLLIFFVWSVPILIICWAYITSSLYKNISWLKYFFLVITVIPGIIFLISIFVYGTWSTVAIEGAIQKNYVYEGITGYLLYYYGFLGIFFVMPSYTYFSIKSTNPLYKLKFRFIAISASLFTIAGMVDGIITFNSIFYVVLLRIMLTTSLIFLFLGYNTPEWIKEKYN